MHVALKVVILAVVQGLAEFLPVSSSGHLVLAKHLLGLDSPGTTLEVGLHAGTLVSIVVFYRRHLLQLARECVSGQGSGRQFARVVALSCLPAALAFALLDDKIEASFDSPMMAGSMLLVTGLVLISLHMRRLRDEAEISMGRGLAVGFAQALALLPGISRSGMTIACGRHLGIAPKAAAELSFLMVVPLLAGATLLKVINGAASLEGDLSVPLLLAGFGVSACVGYAALSLLVRMLARGRFWVFGIYCLILGSVTIICLR